MQYEQQQQRRKTLHRNSVSKCVTLCKLYNVKCTISLNFHIHTFQRKTNTHDYICDDSFDLFSFAYELQFSILFEILIITVSDCILGSRLHICRPKRITLRAVERSHKNFAAHKYYWMY